MNKKNTKRASYNWEKLKREFVETWEPEGASTDLLKQFATLHRINHGFLRKKASPSEGNWLEERRQFQSELEAMRRREAARRLAERSILHDIEEADAATDILELAKNTVEKAKSLTLVSPAKLKTLADTLRQVQVVRRTAAGRPQETVRTQIEMPKAGVRSEAFRDMIMAAREAGMEVEIMVRDYLQVLVDDAFGAGRFMVSMKTAEQVAAEVRMREIGRERRLLPPAPPDVAKKKSNKKENSDGKLFAGDGREVVEQADNEDVENRIRPDDRKRGEDGEKVRGD